MSSEDDQPKDQLWRVGPEVRARVEAFIPILTRRLGLSRMSRGQALEHLINKALDLEERAAQADANLPGG